MVFYIDSMYLKVNVNKGKYDFVMVVKLWVDYWGEFDCVIEVEWVLYGQKLLKEKECKLSEKEIKVSCVDLEVGYMVCEGKLKGFFCFDYCMVDGCCGIIIDSFVMLVNVYDLIVYFGWFDCQVQCFGFILVVVGLDVGYVMLGIVKGLEDRNIWGVVGYCNLILLKFGKMRKSDFIYELDLNGYCCLQGQLFVYVIIDCLGYCQYKSDFIIC